MFVAHLDPWCVSNFMDSRLCLSGPYWVFFFPELASSFHKSHGFAGGDVLA